MQRIVFTLLLAVSAGAQTLHPPVAGGIYAAAKPYQAASTKAMAERLATIFRQSDWKADPNKPAERVPYYQSLLKREIPFAQQTIVQLEMGREQLRAGDSESAIRTFEDLRKRSAEIHQPLSGEAKHQLGEWLALSYLRLGEQENCMHLHGQKSCAFPLHASAAHQMIRGAAGAVRELTALLDADTSEAEFRWLLNVAYMQLGRYPKDVPAKWLLPASLFDSEADVKDFADVAPASGLDVTGHAGGCVMEDFDGDGRLDIMVSSSGPTDQMHLFHNNGNGTFTDVTAQAGLLGETGGLNLVLTDYDNDGHPDVLVLRGGWWGRYGHYPMSLLRNNGNGTFDDVTVAAGLMTEAPTQTAAWADFDGDGFLDLFVGRESTPGDANSSQLFHNNHDGTFTDVAAASGVASLGFVKGVAWGDFNRDGRPDLYVSVMEGRNFLFRNDGGVAGRWRFTDVSEAAGVRDQRRSFATWFFDYDNDGWPDIFVTGYSTATANDVGLFEMGRPNGAERPRLYRNNRDGTFTDMSKATGLDRAILPMGANFGDLDNDGFLDVYLGTGESQYQSLLPNKMFRNDGGRRFQDVTTSGGFGNLQKGHGVAFGDVFGSGNEDVFEEMGGALPGDSYQSMLYRNPGHGNHWITLVLEGTKTNRAGFGARVCVTVRDGAGERKIYRTVGYGSSFGGNPLRQHIGIGKATGVELVEVEWPVSGTTQSFAGLGVDSMYWVREGESRLRSAER